MVAVKLRHAPPECLFLDRFLPSKSPRGGEKIWSEVMKYLVTALLLSVGLLGARSASAESPTPWSRGLVGMFGGGDVIPPEWAGIWATTDTSYDCTGAYMNNGSSEDTLCAGHTFPNPTNFTCTGSATATTFQQTCDGGGNVFANCDYTFHSESQGTRTNDTFFSVTVTSFHYFGSDPSCALFQDTCVQFNLHGTRTGPEPSAYCASPAVSKSWGKVKVLYR
jgi:hypothetical protein